MDVRLGKLDHATRRTFSPVDKDKKVSDAGDVGRRFSRLASTVFLTYARICSPDLPDSQFSAETWSGVALKRGPRRALFRTVGFALFRDYSLLISIAFFNCSAPSCSHQSHHRFLHISLSVFIALHSIDSRHYTFLLLQFVPSFPFYGLRDFRRLREFCFAGKMTCLFLLISSI